MIKRNRSVLYRALTWLIALGILLTGCRRAATYTDTGRRGADCRAHRGGRSPVQCDVLHSAAQSKFISTEYFL